MESQNKANPEKEQAKEDNKQMPELILSEHEDISGELKGMRELFTSMLVENKKEYESQVSSMKTLFTDILNESRRAFQLQIQELYSNLPQVIDHSLREKQKEDYIILTDLEEGRSREQMEKFSRLDAIKEIMLGNNIKDIAHKIKDIQQKLTTQYQENQQRIMTLATEISDQINAVENRITEETKQVIERVSEQLQQHKQQQAERRKNSQLLEELAERMAQED